MSSSSSSRNPTFQSSVFSGGAYAEQAAVTPRASTHREEMKGFAPETYAESAATVRARPHPPPIRKEEFVDPAPPVHHRPAPAPVPAPEPGRPVPTLRFNEDHNPLGGGAWEAPVPTISMTQAAHAPPGTAAYRGREVHVKPHAPPPPPTPYLEPTPLVSTTQAEFTPKTAEKSPRKYNMLSESHPLPTAEKFEAESTLRSSFPAYPPEEYKVKPVPSPRR